MEKKDGLVLCGQERTVGVVPVPQRISDGTEQNIHRGLIAVMENETHHIDGNKANNKIENLKLMPKPAHASKHHRGLNSTNQTIGEKNIIILCACGCGKELFKYDNKRRPRKFIHNHSAKLRGRDVEGKFL